MASAPKKATAKAVTNPVKAEALNEDVTFEYEGDTYTIPSTDEWPLEVLEAFEEGRVVSLLKAILGEEQWTEFKATNPKVKHLNAFVSAIQEATGIAGN